jgi:hypothetical protein
MHFSQPLARILQLVHQRAIDRIVRVRAHVPFRCLVASFASKKVNSSCALGSGPTTMNFPNCGFGRAAQA